MSLSMPNPASYLLRAAFLVACAAVLLTGSAAQAEPLPGEAFVYLTSQDGGEVIVYDAADPSTVTDRIPVAAQPEIVQASPLGDYLYVGCRNPEQIAVLSIADPSDRRQVGTVSVPAPSFISLSPDGKLMLLSHNDLTFVTVVDTESGQDVGQIEVGDEYGHITFSNDGRFAYVTNPHNDSVTVIKIGDWRTEDPGLWEVSLISNVGQWPLYIEASPYDDRIYVANLTSGNLIAIDGNSNPMDGGAGWQFETFGSYEYPAPMAVGPGRLYLGSVGQSSIHVIETVSYGHQYTKPMPGPQAPIQFGLYGNQLFVAYVATEFSVYDTDTGDLVQYPIDGVGDFFSLTVVPHGSLDTDDDGLVNADDNCPLVPNADQLDGDADGQGDACDLLDGSIAANVAYVARAGLSDVAVIDLDEQSLLGSIPVGEFPLDVALATTPEGSFGYVPNQGSTTVSVIATSGHAVVHTIDLGARPFGAEASPDGKYVYVATQSSGEPGPGMLSVIDTATHAVVARLPVGESPAFLGVTPDGGQVYVANQESASVSVVDVASLEAHIVDPAASIEVHSIQLEAAPFNASFSPDGSLVYIPAQGAEGGLVYVYETASDPLTNEHALAGSFPVGQFPTGLVLSLDGTQAYVASAESSTVSIVDIASVLDPEIPLFIETLGLEDGIGAFPVLPELSPDGSLVYLSNHESGNISVISTDSRTVLGSLSLGARVGQTYGLALSPDGQTLYAPASDLGSLEMLDTSSLGSVGTVSLGDGEEPWGVATAPDGTVFVANRHSATVSVVQGESLVATIPVSSFVPQAQSLTGLTVASGRIYVSGGDWTGGVVAVFEASGNYDFVAAVPVGHDLYEIVPSPDGQLVYVASRGSNEVSVIRTADNSLLASISVAAAPMGIAISKDGARVYVTHNQASSMSVIDASLIDIDTGLAPGVDPVLVTVPVGSYPSGVEVSPNGTRVYVASTGSDQVQVFDSGVDASGAALGYAPYLIASFAVGENPTDLAVSLNGEHVYIASYSGSSISILRTDVNGEPNALIGSIAGTPRPTGIVFLPSRGDDDADDDGIDDIEDNCPEHRNPSQTDTDSDGLGDACDEDDDGDGVLDAEDNCSLTPNPDQADLELDGLGDACDPDDDNDGVLDEEDNCPTVPNADQTDANLDGFGDACVSLDAEIGEDVTLGERVIIEAGALVHKGAAIGAGSIVRAGAVIAKGAFVGEDCDIGEGAEINKDVVVGNGVIVGAGAQIKEGVSIGDGAVIGVDALVKAGIHIPAGAIVPDGAQIKTQSEADALPIGS